MRESGEGRVGTSAGSTAGLTMMDSETLSPAAEDRTSGDFSLATSGGMTQSTGSNFGLSSEGHKGKIASSYALRLDHLGLLNHIRPPA